LQLTVCSWYFNIVYCKLTCFPAVNTALLNSSVAIFPKAAKQRIIYYIDNPRDTRRVYYSEFVDAYCCMTKTKYGGFSGEDKLVTSYATYVHILFEYQRHRHL
jgi:hypothetical protein